MFDQHLRRAKDRLLDWPVSLVAATGVGPTTLTLIAAGIGLFAAGLAAVGYREWSVVAWLLNRVFDGLDGAVARKTNRQSDLGGWIDLVFDHVVYAAVPIGVAGAQNRTDVWAATAIMLGLFYVNTCTWSVLAAILEKRARGAANSGEQTSITMPSGLIEGFESIVFYTVLLAIPVWAVPLCGLMAAAVGITIVQRLCWGISALANSRSA